MSLSDVQNVIMQHSNALLYMSCATPLAASEYYLLLFIIFTFIYLHMQLESHHP